MTPQQQPPIGTLITIVPDANFNTELSGATGEVIEHLAHGRIRAKVLGTSGWNNEHVLLDHNEYTHNATYVQE